MRWVYLLLIFVVLLPEPVSHTVYLPIVRHPPCRANRGIAWQRDNTQSWSSKLSTCWYYHASSYLSVANGRAIPIVRPLFPMPDVDVVAKLGHYDGYLLALNEPPRVRQDEVSAHEAAVWVDWLHGQLPLARLVGPNIVGDEEGFGWLEDYLAEGGRPFDAWGIHIYVGGCEPIECLDRLCGLVACGYGTIWVTEIGYDHTRADCHVFGEWLAALEADERVGMIFGYTATDGCCGGRLDFVQDGRYTCTGWQWMEAG